MHGTVSHTEPASTLFKMVFFEGFEMNGKFDLVCILQPELSLSSLKFKDTRKTQSYPKNKPNPLILTQFSVRLTFNKKPFETLLKMNVFGRCRKA